MHKLLITLAVFGLAGLAQTPAPSPSLKKEAKIYELRIYHAAPGKLEALHNRFRQHTMGIFKKHGIHVIGFWGPTDKEKGAENQLIYVLEYASRDAREKAWKAFAADPDWQAARKASEVDGRLAEKVESIYMGEVDYFSAGKK